MRFAIFLLLRLQTLCRMFISTTYIHTTYLYYRDYVLAYNGALIITADHGNTEEMIDQKSGQIDTEHNANPVPFMAIFREFMGKSQTLQTGILADVAPTILNLLGITPPSQMTGKDLLKGIL